MDLSDPRLAAVIDELPLWSAPFGLRLLERARMRHNLTVLDLGCGTGFPMLQLAQWLGPDGRVVGVDPWQAGLERARAKARFMGVDRALLVHAVGEHLPLASASVDLVVSNNGLNNVQDPTAVLAECHRVCRPGAQLVATMNLPATMSVFYEAYAETLAELDLAHKLPVLTQHIRAKRKPREETEALLRAAGFTVDDVGLDEFHWRFLDARALLGDFFIRVGFLDAWRSVVDEADVARVFSALEARLDTIARARGELDLAIPFACFDCHRPR